MTSRYDQRIQREIQVTRLSPEDYKKYRRARGAAITSGLIALFSFWIMYGLFAVLSQFMWRGYSKGPLAEFLTMIMLSIPLAIFALAASSLFKSQARKIRETATEPLLTSKNKE